MEAKLMIVEIKIMREKSDKNNEQKIEKLLVRY